MAANRGQVKRCADAYFIYDALTGLWTTENPGSRLLELVEHTPDLGMWSEETKNKTEMLRYTPHMLEDKDFLDKTDSENAHFMHFTNGVLDMKRRLLLPHDPKYYMISTTKRPYVARDDVPEEDMIRARKLMLDNQELGEAKTAEYAKRLARGLTGEQERNFNVLMGPNGGGGKGFTSRACGAAFGEFVRETHANTFSLSSNSGDSSKPRPELADLQHARLLFTSELAPGLTLDGNMLKKVTGGDKITEGRQLYCKARPFVVQFKLWADCYV